MAALEAKENAEKVILLRCKGSLQLSSVTQAEHSEKATAKPQATDEAERLQ